MLIEQFLPEMFQELDALLQDPKRVSVAFMWDTRDDHAPDDVIISGLR